MMTHRNGLPFQAIMLTLFLANTCPAGTPGSDSDKPSAARGYELLLNKLYTSASMDQEIFDSLWTVWDEPERSQAEKASPAERWRMTLSYYGLHEAPGRARGAPLEFAVQEGKWADNCFLCHGGKVAGQVIPGLPNTHIALATMGHDTQMVKTRLGRKLSRTDTGTILLPLGGSNGTTNAVIFGVFLANFRDLDLNYVQNKPIAKMVHNDHDAPPWWHYKRKNFLYADGFAGKGHRALMQFMMTPENDAQFFRDVEADFHHVQAFIESVQPPKYPFPIDSELARKGEMIYVKNCSECHGTYGVGGVWPAKVVSLDVVGTDRLRLDSISPEARRWHHESWFGEYGKKPVVVEPEGYVAQPLDGIWATAPYLHNGSVPTLWHLFHADRRPVVWKRTEDGYDQTRVGLEVEELTEVPSEARKMVDKRRYFDTRKAAKSAEGHTFPEALSEEEKTAVIEYLKTL
jgi:mono/diheme cytochrome c family protein